MSYLEDAAAELAKARAANEERAAEATQMHSGLERDRRLILLEVNGRRMEIAEAFIALAAIEAGLSPCCCHSRPEPGQETP